MALWSIVLSIVIKISQSVSCLYSLQKAPVFTIDAMKNPFEALGYEIVGELTVYRIFDKAKVKRDKESMHKALELGEKLPKSIKM